MCPKLILFTSYVYVYFVGNFFVRSPDELGAKTGGTVTFGPGSYISVL